jgi:hypothetical protein
MLPVAVDKLMKAGRVLGSNVVRNAVFLEPGEVS